MYKKNTAFSIPIYTFMNKIGYLSNQWNECELLNEREWCIEMEGPEFLTSRTSFFLSQRYNEGYMTSRASQVSLCELTKHSQCQ